MLILTRSIGQRIRIGDDINLSIIEVNGNQVRIGINAPKSVAVHRSEIYDKISSENQVNSSEVKSTEAKKTQVSRATKSDLYSSLVAKMNTHDEIKKTTPTKKTVITVQQHRHVAQ